MVACREELWGGKKIECLDRVWHPDISWCSVVTPLAFQRCPPPFPAHPSFLLPLISFLFFLTVVHPPLKALPRHLSSFSSPTLALYSSLNLLAIFCFFLKARSCCIPQAGPDLVVILLCGCWDYRCAPPLPTFASFPKCSVIQLNSHQMRQDVLLVLSMVLELLWLGHIVLDNMETAWLLSAIKQGVVREEALNSNTEEHCETHTHTHM